MRLSIELTPVAVDKNVTERSIRRYCSASSETREHTVALPRSFQWEEQRPRRPKPEPKPKPPVKPCPPGPTPEEIQKQKEQAEQQLKDFIKRAFDEIQPSKTRSFQAADEIVAALKMISMNT